MADELRGDLGGSGFFARNHQLAWREVQEVRVAAICDRERDRTRAAREESGAEEAFDDAESMLRAGGLDFVDVLTTPESHRTLVELAAQYGTYVICQKPLAPSLEDAATVLLEMLSGAHCVVDLSYGTRPLGELFPQTPVHLEATEATTAVGPDYFLESVRDPRDTEERDSRRIDDTPPERTWSRLLRALIHDAVLSTQRHFAHCLRTGSEAETSVDDNLRTLEDVFGVYESAASVRPFRVGATREAAL